MAELRRKHRHLKEQTNITFPSQRFQQWQGILIKKPMFCKFAITFNILHTVKPLKSWWRTLHTLELQSGSHLTLPQAPGLQQESGASPTTVLE